MVCREHDPALNEAPGEPAGRSSLRHANWPRRRRGDAGGAAPRASGRGGPRLPGRATLILAIALALARTFSPKPASNPGPSPSPSPNPNPNPNPNPKPKPNLNPSPSPNPNPRRAC
eukprot:scaffold87156_cov30-Phaeocystis_antarctica.AAC.1